MPGCAGVYAENHCFARSTGRNHRDDDTARLRRNGRYAVREADADSSKRARSGEYRQSHDKNCDETGLFALYARRFYTDCGTIRSRHANRSVERKSHVSLWAAPKDVESNCLQSGMGRFGHRSGKLRLQVAALNCCKNIYIAKDPSTLR